MKTVKKMLAAALAAAIAVTCVVPAYAQGDPSETKPGQDVAVDNPSADGMTSTGLDTVVSTSQNGTAKLTEVQKTNKKSVKVSKKVEVNGVKYTVTTITADAFANCRKATKVELPSTVKKIASGAFRGAKNLKNAEIKGTPTVKKGAFKGAEKLKKVTFTNAAKITSGAFKGTKLNKIVVGKKVDFGKNAFKGANTQDTVIKINGTMTQKQYNEFKKMLDKAGFKGDIDVKIKKKKA